MVVDCRELDIFEELLHLLWTRLVVLLEILGLCVCFRLQWGRILELVHLFLRLHPIRNFFLGPFFVHFCVLKQLVTNLLANHVFHPGNQRLLHPNYLGRVAYSYLVGASIWSAHLPYRKGQVVIVVCGPLPVLLDLFPDDEGVILARTGQMRDVHGHILVEF